MKNKKSITIKLFTITSIVFIIFITINLIVQSTFFAQFYIKWKKDNLEHSLVKFKSQYILLKNPQEEATLISSFEEENGYKIIIRDSVGNLKYLTKTVDEKKDSRIVRTMNQIMTDEIEKIGGITNLKEKPVIFITDQNRDNDGKCSWYII